MENQVLDTGLIANDDQSQNRYAGFWIRVGAQILDTLILIPLIGINMVNIYNLKSFPLQITITILMILYKPFMEYKYSATFGKMIVKIKVVDMNFGQINLHQAILRYVPWIFRHIFALYSTVILFQHPGFIDAKGVYEVGLLQNELISPALNYIGSAVVLISCVVVGFTANKQGIHDILAKTLCIYKNN